MSEPGVADRVGPLAAIPGDLPDPDAVVDATGNNEAAVGGNRHGVLALGRFVEGIESLAGLEVPELDGAVAAGGGKKTAPGVKRHVEDRPVVAGHLHSPLAAGRLPDNDRAVIGCGGQQGAVGRECHAVEAVGVASDGPHQPGHLFGLGPGDVLCDRVNPRFTEQPRFAGGGDQVAAIGRECQVADLTGESCQGRQRLGPGLRWQ